MMNASVARSSVGRNHGADATIDVKRCLLNVQFL